MSVAGVEDDIVAEGVEFIWVIEELAFGETGLLEHCDAFNDVTGSQQGWCVGDGETQPVASAFDDSPFSNARGFDMLVDRSTMEIVYTTTHGTGAADENITAEQLLAAIRGFTQ